MRFCIKKSKKERPYWDAPDADLWHQLGSYCPIDRTPAPEKKDVPKQPEKPLDNEQR